MVDCARISLILFVALLWRPVQAAIIPRSWEKSFALANAAVEQMTLDEKIGVVSGVGTFVSRCVGSNGAVPRLGIPSICMQDGPAGIRIARQVTGFPTGINAASTFSRRLIRARGVALGEEYRGKGINVYLGPALDIARTPKAGRNWESFGPDPYLTAEAGYETIVGVQSVGVQACAKHFLANNQEHWRYGLSADVDDRTTQELYMYPYYRAVEANVSSVMCSYNRVNQTSACQNEALLGPNGYLRKTLGFQGYTVSDWGATHDTPAQNANAGLDMEQPGDWILVGGGTFKLLKTAVLLGNVSINRINEMVARVLAPFYRLRQDDPSFPPPNFDIQRPDLSGPQNLNVSVRSEAHTELAREIAAASTVLLKNSDVNGETAGNAAGVGGKMLPLRAGFNSSVAIVGLGAAPPATHCDQNKCNQGAMVIGWGSGSYSLENVVPPVAALQDRITSTGGVVASSLTNDIPEGMVAATGKDVAMVFVNAMSGELGFYDVVMGNMGDRNDLELWYQGGRLVEAVAAVNQNTIVVVYSVGPVTMPWADHPNVTAVLYAGAPGEQAGPGLVDVLWGTVNPRGRLPFSMDDNESSYPAPIVYASLGFPTIEYTEKLWVDYRYMDAMGITPRYPFGYGLSYTTFSYSGLAISSSPPGYTVSFTVKNTGPVAGTEIAQMYLGFPDGSGEPKKVLRGFEEVESLEAGQSRRVRMTLNEREISLWDVVMQRWTRPAGEFRVFVGASIEDVRLAGSF